MPHRDSDPIPLPTDSKQANPLAEIWQPPRPRSGAVSIGDVAGDMQKMIERRLNKSATDRAGYLGDCYDCQDTGFRTMTSAPCTCAMGEKAAKTQHAADIAAIIATMGIPKRHAASTFETYPGSPEYRQRILDFLQEWDGERGLYLWGNYGVGKTGLMVAALKWIAAAYSVSQDRNKSRPGAIRFLTLPDMLNNLRAAYETNSYDQLVRIYQRTPLLALDDIGAERAKRDQEGGSWVIEQLYIVLGHRHEEMLPTFLTSNLNMAELLAAVTDRVTWRIHEMCQAIKLDGPNLRERS